LEEQMYIRRNEAGYWNLLGKGENFIETYKKKNRLKGLYQYLGIDIPTLLEHPLDIDTPYVPITSY
jgi:hypothetical protein